MACDRSPGEGEGRGWRPLTISVRETEAVKVPAQRSGAACPAGAVTVR